MDYNENKKSGYLPLDATTRHQLNASLESIMAAEDRNLLNSVLTSGCMSQEERHSLIVKGYLPSDH